MTDGMKTSEFWLSLAVLVCATVVLGLDKITADAWVIIVTGITAVYTGARTITKVTSNGQSS